MSERAGGYETARNPQPPLACAHCGMPLWNDHTATWVGPEGNRMPYCTYGETGSNLSGCWRFYDHDQRLSVERILRERP